MQPDGSVKNKRMFAQLRDIPEGKESGAEGITTRSRGSSSFYGAGSGIIFVSVEVPTYGTKP